LRPCTAEEAAHNLCIEPTIGRTLGAYPLDIAAAPARECATYLQQYWVGPNIGKLDLGGGRVLTGYNTYRGTLVEPANPQRQLRDTLLVMPGDLASARERLPGFRELAVSATRRLAFFYSVPTDRFVLRYAHFLSQGPKSRRAALFGWHRDTDVATPDDDGRPISVAHTVIVKLTDDAPGAPAWQLQVAAAADPFSYGAAAGSACVFWSALWHASVLPQVADSCLKLALFYDRVPLPSV
jgi:hypothetical protein